MTGSAVRPSVRDAAKTILGFLDKANACLSEVQKDYAAVDMLMGLNFGPTSDLYRRLVELKPNSPEILFNAGLLEQKAQNHQAAIKLYTQALALKTEFAEAYLNLAIAHQTLGADNDANQAFEKAIRLKPELAKGYFALTPPGSQAVQ